MSTRNILLDVAGEFASTDPAKLDRFIGYAVALLGTGAPTTFGNKLGLAVSYYAAHLLALDDRGRRHLLGSGRVTSQSESSAGKSVGFAPQLLNKIDSDEALRATPYGSQYLAIRDSLSAGLPRVIVSSAG
jgi:hypothetical protein